MYKHESPQLFVIEKKKKYISASELEISFYFLN